MHERFAELYSMEGDNHHDGGVDRLLTVLLYTTTDAASP
jgi:hypothetical protein